VGDIYVLILYSVGRHLPKNGSDSEKRNMRERSKEKVTGIRRKRENKLTNGKEDKDRRK
jgi:hypothetical protein